MILGQTRADVTALLAYSERSASSAAGHRPCLWTSRPNIAEALVVRSDLVWRPGRDVAEAIVVWTWLSRRVGRDVAEPLITWVGSKGGPGRNVAQTGVGGLAADDRRSIAFHFSSECGRWATGQVNRPWASSRRSRGVCSGPRALEGTGPQRGPFGSPRMLRQSLVRGGRSRSPRRSRGVCSGPRALIRPKVGGECQDIMRVPVDAHVVSDPMPAASASN
jgi:hypothetical protein